MQDILHVLKIECYVKSCFDIKAFVSSHTKYTTLCIRNKYLPSKTFDINCIYKLYLLNKKGVQKNFMCYH